MLHYTKLLVYSFMKSDPIPKNLYFAGNILMPPTLPKDIRRETITAKVGLGRVLLNALSLRWGYSRTDSSITLQRYGYAIETYLTQFIGISLSMTWFKDCYKVRTAHQKESPIPILATKAKNITILKTTIPSQKIGATLNFVIRTGVITYKNITNPFSYDNLYENAPST